MMMGNVYKGVFLVAERPWRSVSACGPRTFFFDKYVGVSASLSLSLTRFRFYLAGRMDRLWREIGELVQMVNRQDMMMSPLF